MATTESSAATPARIRDAVRDRYAQAALALTGTAGDGSGCCGPDCCGAPAAEDPISRDLYRGEFAQEAETVSAGALQASLGCGNPLLLADLAPGETVLDLGSGGGLDVLLSARRVGPDGHAYGVDMTPEMLDLARRHQSEAGITNATFLQGTIEDLPLRDGLVDVVISNCVINLSGDKDAVLGEAFRVLRPGGRFAVADVVLLRELPEVVRPLMALWTGCVSGALHRDDYLARLAAAGFVDARVEITRRYDRADVEEFAAGLSPDLLPPGLDVPEVLEALDGAAAGAFVRARRP